jgi:hypothetical protein
MPRFAFIAAFLFCFTAAGAASAQCTADPSGTCNGHKHLKGADYPYSEDFGAANVVVGQGACCTSYVTVVEGCPARSYVNISNTANTNLLMRGWLQIGSATAPAGSEFAVRFNVDGVIRGEYVRKLTGHYPQGEDFNAVYPNLGTGNHQVRMQAWLIDSPGTSMTISQSFVELQGVPATLPAGATANGATATIDDTWRQITDTLSFNNATAVNLFTQGYVQFNSGTPGQHISFGFSLDGANSPRNIEVGVPPTFPSGINVFDHYINAPGYVNVPAGPHTLSMWARNIDGGSSTVQWRQIEYFALNATSDQPMLDAINSTPVTVHMTGDGSQVFQPFFTYQSGTNPWTKLLQYEYPATYSGTPQNGAGEVAVEFLGTTNGQWQQIDIGVEVLYNPTYDASGNPTGAANTADFTIESLMIPPGRHQKFIYTHPLWWDLTVHPNLIRLFVRKSPGTPSGEFMVGKRHMSFRAVSTPNWTACQFD